MRLLVAPQEFKGTLTASEAASVIAAAARGLPGVEAVDEVPLSDGGPGLIEVLLAAREGNRLPTPVHDPLMRPIEATWALLSDATAVIEMAAASGLELVRPGERDALRATTFGTGELIRAALDGGCTSIIIGLGGSATTDAGAGAMQALGARLLDERGADLEPGGAALGRLQDFDLSRVDQRLPSMAMRIATDVRNPLSGPDGAARMYARQKGASDAEIEQLDDALSRFARVARTQLNVDLLALADGGAAGGLACGLTLLEPSTTTIEPGFALVAEIVRLGDRIASCDAVITGEGRFDEQTAYGKTAAGVANLARGAGKPVYLVAGSVGPGASRSAFDRVEACIAEGDRVPGPVEARALLARATVRILSG